MKLAVISMIRDEADIIGLFLRHLAALFDLVYLLDHFHGPHPRGRHGRGLPPDSATLAMEGDTVRFQPAVGQARYDILPR